jgi:hypothetical protein
MKSNIFAGTLARPYCIVDRQKCQIVKMQGSLFNFSRINALILNNPQQYQKNCKNSKKNQKVDVFVTHVTKLSRTGAQKLISSAQQNCKDFAQF